MINLLIRDNTGRIGYLLRVDGGREYPFLCSDEPDGCVRWYTNKVEAL